MINEFSMLRKKMSGKYMFSNILGCFVLDNNLNVIDMHVWKNSQEYADKEKVEEKLKKKYKKFLELNDKKEDKILQMFHDQKYFEQFHKRNVVYAKQKVRESVQKDTLLIQVVNTIDELDKVINMLVRRLREWYGYYNPETTRKIQDNEKFVELVLKKGKKELLGEMGISSDVSLGGELSKDDVSAIKDYAKKIIELFSLREQQKDYLDKLMDEICPNMTALTGTLIGAKLIEKAGSLERLMGFPASTIQIIGAEKALFRHMRNKSKNLPPKYGILHEHPFISNVKYEFKGKAARQLADKIAIAVKVDYFKGKFVGKELREKIEKQIKKWQKK